MKNFLILLTLLTSLPSAFAICIPQDKEVASVNAEYFNSEEQELIYSTMKLDTWRAISNMSDAVWQFEDRENCERERSPDAGEIVYYSSGLTLVHHSRNGKDYGAYFQGKKMIATVDANKLKCL